MLNTNKNPTSNGFNRKVTFFVALWMIFVALIATWSWALRDFSGDIAGAIRMRSQSMQVASQVRDMRGQSIGVFSDETRYIVKFDQIPLMVRHAFLAAEDDGFYSHSGVSLKGLVRAAIANMRQDRFAQGGSTITQQLVRQFLLPREKTIARKIREIVLAVTLERQMSKNEILDIWLNSVYLGNNSWGVETASKHYFNKSVDQLTIAEASLIAGLPQAPSRYAPHLRPKAARQRQLYVLGRMKRLGWIDRFDMKIARNEKLKIEPTRPEIVDQSPWVTEAVRLELWHRLEQKNLPKSGLVINTTINGEWQRSLQDLVASTFPGIHKDGLEMSLVVLDTRSGEIRALIGGSNFARSQFNRAFDLYRPIGAIIYPMIFGWAVEAGMLKVDGYASMAEAAVKSRFAEAEQIAPEMGYALVRDKLMGLGFVVKDAMAIDEMHGSPLTLARSYLSVAGSRAEIQHGLIGNVLSGGQSIYSSQSFEHSQPSRFNPSIGWVLRQWMALGSAGDSRELAGQPLLKAVKGWNSWWVIARNDVVMTAWIGAESREPKNPRALRDADAKMDAMLSSWIKRSLKPADGLGNTPEGISYQITPGGGGRPATRIPFIAAQRGVF
jgi:hypothetical protein